MKKYKLEFNSVNELCKAADDLKKYCKEQMGILEEECKERGFHIIDRGLDSFKIEGHKFHVTEKDEKVICMLAEGYTREIEKMLARYNVVLNKE